MKAFKLTRQAALDLRQIINYIAEDNGNAARRVSQQLLQAFELLATEPKIGHRRPDLTDEPALFWPVGSYLVIYDPNSSPIVIARVAHGARDLLNFPVFS